MPASRFGSSATTAQQVGSVLTWLRFPSPMCGIQAPPTSCAVQDAVKEGLFQSSAEAAQRFICPRIAFTVAAIDLRFRGVAASRSKDVQSVAPPGSRLWPET